MIEIAKAMAARANLFVLDEPTTALGASEAGHLHDLLLRMREAGAAILYVSTDSTRWCVWLTSLP